MDDTIGHLLRVSTTEIEVDFTELSSHTTHPEILQWRTSCININK